MRKIVIFLAALFLLCKPFAVRAADNDMVCVAPSGVVISADPAAHLSAAKEQTAAFVSTLPAYTPSWPTPQDIMIQNAYDIYVKSGVDKEDALTRLQKILPSILAAPDHYGAVVGADIAAWRIERQMEFASEYAIQQVFNYYVSTGLSGEQALEATQIVYGMRTPK